MARIRELAAGNLLVGAALAVCCLHGNMAAATRNPAAEFLPGGICAAESITAYDRQRLSGMPMTSTGAERVFPLGRAHDVRAGASRENTRVG
eukprot:5903094-Pleurochrysis_carterae.AAC.1